MNRKVIKRSSPDIGDRDWAHVNYLSKRSLAEAENVRSQLLSIMERHGLVAGSDSYPTDPVRRQINIKRALCCGFFMQVAHREGFAGEYLTVKDSQVIPTADPSSWKLSYPRLPFSILRVE